MRTARPARERWLVPPRLRTISENAAERRASWLELFFDLVFVVAITQLSHLLVEDHSVAGFARFGGLFVPVFVAWQGFMAYADRFDTDDLAFRLSYFGAMLAVSAMGVLIDDVARGAHTAGFAIAYVTLRVLMLLLYARTWRAVPDARSLIRFYGLGYSAGVAIWVASLAPPTPARYWMWGVAQVLELSLPPLSTRLHRRIPTSATHLPERWALFTLIVIGESVAAVGLEVSNASWTASSATAAVLGFAAVAAVWWLYFDRASGVALTGGTRAVVIYSYAHIPLLIGLASMSAGVRMLIERAGEAHLGTGPAVALLGGVAVFILSLIGMRAVTVAGPHRKGIILKSVVVALIAALLIAARAMPPVTTAAGLVGVLVAMVAAERAILGPPRAG